MSSPPVPYIVGNVYHTYFQTRASPTHPDHRGTYTPPGGYMAGMGDRELSKGNLARIDTYRTIKL